MRILHLAGIALFLLAVPVFLVTTNVRWVIGTPALYVYGFDRYDVPSRTGIPRGELLSAGRQIRDYFANDEEYLDVRVRLGGVLLSIYKDREVRHMRDVKGLVRGVYRAQEVSGAYLAVFALVGLAVGRRRFLVPLARLAGVAGALTVSLVALVGLGSLLGFDRLFLVFHLISFSNDLWQLDPRTDYLIAMFPEGIFFAGTLWIAASTLVEGAILALALPALVGHPLWRRGRQGSRSRPRSPSKKFGGSRKSGREAQRRAR